MKLRMTLLAASLAVLSAAPAMANTQLLGAPTVAPSSPQQINSMVANLAAKSGLSADHGYSLKGEHTGAAGQKVTRLHHTFKGVRVFESESVVVSNAAGATLFETHADRRQGLGTNGFAAGADMNPKLAAKDAIAVAVKGVAANGTHMDQPSAELILFPITKTQRVASAVNKAEAELNAVDLETVVTGHKLAFLVKTRMLNAGKPVLHDTIVSAEDGSVLKRFSAMHNVVGSGKSQYNGTVPINTTLSGSTYSMLDATRGTGGTYGGMAITNANHGTTAGSIYTNTTNTWGDGLQYVSGGSTTNANGQTAAVNALWGAMNTYDTLNNVLGWKSLNGQNAAFYIAAHVNSNYDNAYYDDTCKCMFIGDGSSFYSLGSIDVIGHEMGHGVTAATSNLTYSGESGGLNESNSDITGDMVEAYARNGGTGTVIPAGNDWEVGKEIAKNGVALRHMIKPSTDGSSADAWSSSVGGLDVHYSSGPNNRMFYFLSQGSNATVGNNAYSSYLKKCPAAMTGIGNDHAYRIWFNALTTRFTASTNYAGARTNVIAAAQALYGVGSKEDIAVQRAYAAINVGADVDEPGAAGCAVGGVSISGQPASVTVAVGGTASFSVTATGGTAPYKYQWRRNGANITGATAATYSLANAQTTDSGAVFSVVVTDSATTPTTATSGNATLTVGTVTQKENIVNGGFESSTTGWAGTTGAIGTWTGEPAQTGTRNAWLGGNGSAVTETLTQTVAIPAAATSATLTFGLHIDSAETTTTTAYDKLTVTLKNTAGTVLKTLATYSNLNKATGYQTRTFDVTAYKGQTVVVSFSETEDSTLQTSFAIDNVSLISK
jgi:Zn-dependent metalloprotease